MQSHSVHCPLCDCIHWIHWFDLFAPKNNVPTTIYHYSTVSTAHYIHWFDLFAPKTMSPPPYTTMPLCTASSGLTFLHQRQCPQHNIPLCHCVLHTLVWLFCTNTYCVHCVTTAWGVDFFCTNTYCVLCTSLHGVWPFCTKGNGSHHPYLLSTLCEFTFLHQHLLHTAYLTAWGLNFLH